MCGIVGYIGKRPAKDIILEGLRHLEYRGYDSSGIALLEDEKIEIIRATGKLASLYSKLLERKFDATLGIGHTRWATHGKPSEENAHPHRSGSIALVHNGIIENYLELKKMLVTKGYRFSSETDTEVIAHLIDYYYRENPLMDAVVKALSYIKGSYAVVLISEKEKNKLIAFRKDSPLVIGMGDGENFVASDIPALLSHTRRFIFLEDGDIAQITGEGVEIFNSYGEPVKREVKHINWNPVMAERAGYKHFMEKEIHEQPRAITDTIRGRISLERGEVYFEGIENIEDDIKKTKHIIFSACGTSWHASLLGKLFMERFAHIQ